MRVDDDPLEGMDWDDLKVFLVAVRRRSVSGAARAVGLSHSTVSRRLARLEAAVGAGLFQRSQEGLSLTTTGTLVLRRAEELEQGVSNLRADLSGTDAAGGRVRLATMEGIASLFLASRLVTLAQTHPDLQVELLVSPRTIRVARREADLFLSFFNPPGAGMVSRMIGSFDVGLYAAPAYLARHGMPGTRAELSRHEFVGYIEDMIRVDAVRWLNELVENPRLAFTSNSMISQMAAAVAGGGIVALPKFALGPTSGLERVLPGLRARRQLWLSIHRDMESVPRVRMLAQWIQGVMVADHVSMVDRD